MINEPIIWPPKYIDPTTDFGFKRIFKDEEITRGFLNDLVQSRNPDVHIASVTITDGEADEAKRFAGLFLRQNSSLPCTCGITAAG